MSDKPLFEDMDQKEQTYAPQQLPEGHPAEQRVEADEQTDARDTGAPGAVVLPVAGAGLVGHGAAASGANTPTGAAPAVGAAALAEESERSDEDQREDR